VVVFGAPHLLCVRRRGIFFQCQNLVHRFVVRSVSMLFQNFEQSGFGGRQDLDYPVLRFGHAQSFRWWPWLLATARISWPSRPYIFSARIARIKAASSSSIQSESWRSFFSSALNENSEEGRRARGGVSFVLFTLLRTGIVFEPPRLQDRTGRLVRAFSV